MRLRILLPIDRVPAVPTEVSEMSHAPKFFADKLPASQRVLFWNLVTEWGFTGETAYCRIVSGTYAVTSAKA